MNLIESLTPPLVFRSGQRLRKLYRSNTGLPIRSWPLETQVRIPWTAK